jgi:hypothetical protein
VNPLLVVLLAWLCTGLEVGLRHALTIHMGVTGSPSFVVPLAVVIALCAPATAALWSCMGLGLCLDLTSHHTLLSGDVVFIPGPHALGLTVAAQFVLAVRGVVMRRNPLSVVVLSVGAAAICGIVVTALLTARHLYDPIAWRPTQALLERLFSALLTGGSALVMSAILLPLSPMLGLQPARHWVRR